MKRALLLLALLLGLLGLVMGLGASCNAYKEEEEEEGLEGALAGSSAGAEALEEQAMQAAIQQEALVQLELCDVAQKHASDCTSGVSAEKCNDEYAVKHLGACFTACECSRERCQDKEECRKACENTVSQELVDRIMKQREEMSGVRHLQCHLNDAMDEKIQSMKAMLAQIVKENEAIQKHMPSIRCNNEHDCLAASRAAEASDADYQASLKEVKENRERASERKVEKKRDVQRLDKALDKVEARRAHKGKSDDKGGDLKLPKEALKEFPELKAWKARELSQSKDQLEMLAEEGEESL